MAYEAMPGRGCRQSSDGCAASCDLHKPTDHDTNNTNLSLLLLLLFFFLLRYNYVSVPQSSSAIGWN